MILQNGKNGLGYPLTWEYTAAAGTVDHNQIWANAGFGVQIDSDFGDVAQGSMPNGTHNNIYDNGLDPFKDGSQFTINDGFMRTDADWTNNYWGTGEAASGPAGMPCPRADDFNDTAAPNHAARHTWLHRVRARGLLGRRACNGPVEALGDPHDDFAPSARSISMSDDAERTPEVPR